MQTSIGLIRVNNLDSSQLHKENSEIFYCFSDLVDTSVTETKKILYSAHR